MLVNCTKQFWFYSEAVDTMGLKILPMSIYLVLYINACKISNICIDEIWTQLGLLNYMKAEVMCDYY